MPFRMGFFALDPWTSSVLFDKEFGMLDEENVVDVSAVDASAMGIPEDESFKEKLSMFRAGLLPFDGVELDLRPHAMMINGNLD